MKKAAHDPPTGSIVIAKEYYSDQGNTVGEGEFGVVLEWQNYFNKTDGFALIEWQGGGLTDTVELAHALVQPSKINERIHELRNTISGKVRVAEEELDRIDYRLAVRKAEDIVEAAKELVELSGLLLRLSGYRSKESKAALAGRRVREVAL